MLEIKALLLVQVLVGVLLMKLLMVSWHDCPKVAVKGLKFLTDGLTSVYLDLFDFYCSKCLWPLAVRCTGHRPMPKDALCFDVSDVTFWVFPRWATCLHTRQ